MLRSARLTPAARATLAAAVAVGTLAGCRSTPAPAAPAAPSAPTPAALPAAAAPPATAAPVAATTPPPAPGARSAPLALQLPPGTTSLDAHRVVPAPLLVTPAEGAPFVLASGTAIVVSAGDTAAARVADDMAAHFRPATGFPLRVAASDAAAPVGSIVLRLGGDAVHGDEGYALTVRADSVQLVARRPAGLYRGVQTLRQLLPPGIEAEQSTLRMAATWSVPAGRIEDRPRFAWRGAMLDVARHFFTVDEVKQYVDLLALYKFNVLHVHLSDDQGWRIQIDRWPKLTTVGGSTEVGGGPGGFYTKADWGEIVRHAQARFITVVPEIDLPGHTNAAIAAYPEIGCSRPTPGLAGGTQPAGLYTGIRVGWSTVCPDKAITYRFVEDVVRELAAMTPGPYLHIGGDEVEALTDAQYAGFMARVQDIVAKYGKTAVGWEEIGKAPLRPGTIAQQWRSDSALLAVRQGAKLILSPGPRTYLDMKYTPGTELGLRWAGFIELRTAYDWEPTAFFPGVGPNEVLGVEAPLWTETVPNLTAAYYLLMPRLPALAEVGWSTTRDWERFRTRLAAHAPRWRLLGIGYYPSPQVDWEPLHP